MMNRCLVVLFILCSLAMTLGCAGTDKNGPSRVVTDRIVARVTEIRAPLDNVENDVGMMTSRVFEGIQINMTSRVSNAIRPAVSRVSRRGETTKGFLYEGESLVEFRATKITDGFAPQPEEEPDDKADANIPKDVLLMDVVVENSSGFSYGATIYVYNQNVVISQMPLADGKQQVWLRYGRKEESSKLIGTLWVSKITIISRIYAKYESESEDVRNIQDEDKIFAQFSERKIAREYSAEDSGASAEGAPAEGERAPSDARYNMVDLVIDISKISKRITQQQKTANGLTEESFYIGKEPEYPLAAFKGNSSIVKQRSLILRERGLNSSSRRGKLKDAPLFTESDSDMGMLEVEIRSEQRGNEEILPRYYVSFTTLTATVGFDTEFLNGRMRTLVWYIIEDHRDSKQVFDGRRRHIGSIFADTAIFNSRVSLLEEEVMEGG